MTGHVCYVYSDVYVKLALHDFLNYGWHEIHGNHGCPRKKRTLVLGN